MAGNTVRIKAILDDKVSGGLDKIKGRFDQLGKSKGAASLLQGVGLGAGAAGFALVGSAASVAADYIGESINAARDMSETISKSNTVFGTSASMIEDWGGTTAKSMGISKQASIDAAAGFGFLFTGLGKTSQEAATMSQAMVTMAGDMASFNNIDPTEALDKLKSGLSGESEPLRKLGIFLTEAKVKAKAMEMGLQDANGELSEGAKVTARYALIMKEAGVQVGDAGRTIGQLAGQQRVATAALKDAQAELGTKFQPIALEVTKMQIAAVEGFDLMAVAAEAFSGRSGVATQKMVQSWVVGAPKVSTLAGKMADDVLVGSGKMADDLIGDGKRGAAGVGKVATAFDRLRGVAVDRSGKSATAFSSMVDSLAEDAARAIGSALDPVALKLKTLGDAADLNAARVAEAAGTRTVAEREASLEAVRTLGESLVTMKTQGLEGSKAYTAGMAALKKYAKSSSGETKTAVNGVLDAINAVKKAGKWIPIRFNLSGTYTGGPGGAIPVGLLASGGPAKANAPYVVGEDGPELFVPSSSGFVIPNGGGLSGPSSSSSGSGGLTVNFNSVWPPTREQARDIARVMDEAWAKPLQRAAPTAGRV